jgi:hypothetical protein
MLICSGFSLEYFVVATRASSKSFFYLTYLSGEARLAPTPKLHHKKINLFDVNSKIVKPEAVKSPESLRFSFLKRVDDKQFP